jgi:molybdopterin/thiamine biosynthesis adenylyltransferase
MNCDSMSGLLKYKIKDSVDVYIINNNNSCRFQFYKINTREKITIEADEKVSDILSLLDGLHTNNDILERLDFNFERSEFFSFMEFLVNNGIIYDVFSRISLKGVEHLNRYSRQINYFDDLLKTTPGITSQNTLSNSHVAIFGVGSIGGAIAIELVRSGVGEVTLYDYKVIDSSHKQRHFYFKNKYIDQFKTHALKDYLLEINSNCKVNAVVERLSPQTNLASLLHKSINLVINTADEPYIGHTTVKLGRELWRQGIALYAAGGFDAHLMSTGEFIIPGKTPCVDCYSQHFKMALADWRPQYAPLETFDSNKEAGEGYNPLGGAGGISAQALFSASYGCINIVNFLLGNETGLLNKSNRGEYIANKAIMTWFNLQGAVDCNVCGKK